MAVIDRVARRLVESSVPWERPALEEAARRLLPVEAPLARDITPGDVADTLLGLGRLEPLLRDPAVSDVLVNASGEVWVERRGALQLADVRFDDPQELRAAVERVIAPLGLRLDRASPAVDARLPDGSRLHAVIPPASVDGPVVAVRRFTEAVADLAALEASGAVTADGAILLQEAVQSRRNLLVTGGTGSGKTTLLNVLSKEIPAGERVVSVEDAAELRLSGHVVRLEARPPNVEGYGEVTLRQLLRHALRLRPDRIVVGEVRGPEAFDMLQAISTGHDGSMSTIHASSPEEALWRLETLALTAGAGVSEQSVHRQVRRALDVVVEVARTREGRRVRSIVQVGEHGLEERYRCC